MVTKLVTYTGPATDAGLRFEERLDQVLAQLQQRQPDEIHFASHVCLNPFASVTLEQDTNVYAHYSALLVWRSQP